MSTIDHCVIIDNNTSRMSLIEKTLKENKIVSTIKHALNCGHALLYLNEMWLSKGERNTLVIMNVNTPIMNGHEFLDELKATPYSRSANFLLIAMDDTINERDKETYQKKGVIHYLSSTFSYECILNMLKDKFHGEEKSEKQEPVERPSHTNKPNNKTMNSNR